MYPIPPNETLVETKVCKHCGQSFPITDKDLEFYKKVSPTFGGKKYSIPTPTLCPDCRQQRRLSFRNEKTVNFRTCDLTGKRTFSMYSPDKLYKIYHYEDWFTDKWNPKNYGRDFDFSRSFFDQIAELNFVVPKASLSNLNMENSDYVSQAGNCKNCYMIFNADSNENCYYGKDIFFSKNSVDNFGLGESEECYECNRCIKCSNVQYGISSYNCSSCFYIHSCVGCQDCIGCVGMMNAKYMIFNQQYSKEEFDIKKKILTGAQVNIAYQELLKTLPRNQFFDVKNAENFLGDVISDSKDIFSSFNIAHSRNVKYTTNMIQGEDIFDVNYYGTGNLSRSFESMSIGGSSSSLLFCFDCWDTVSNLLYCIWCVKGVKNCFGCVGLHNNEQYCILNKQYTREEYETLVPRIIEHMMKTREWGEFFPASLSPFGYNETVAQEYFPLSKEEAIKDRIFNWSDYEPPFPKVEKIIPANKLPDDITKIPDDILNWAIECEVTQKPFRIIKQELEFYRKHNLPIPRRHPDQRHLDRMALRNPRKLFERKCDKCGKEIITTYAPDRKEIVYCEECYLEII